ncbi:hypothetical protein, partial [Bradyrhizobium sp.]|uniref:hypothetical protein n=1 Tax=Bradyrhizobium sp. TaxID=376 RepID=UPI003C3798DA
LDFVSLDLRDWIAYAGAPTLANACLLVGAAGLIAEKSFAPYPIAGAVMLFLFAGILDAWDMTLWIVGNRDMAKETAIGGNARLRADARAPGPNADITPDST